jgi:hypothetical protein
MQSEYPYIMVMVTLSPRCALKHPNMHADPGGVEKERRGRLYLSTRCLLFFFTRDLGKSDGFFPWRQACDVTYENVSNTKQS